ncbi:MAG: tryptophan halogenase family protein [Wenzhouxiangellaceae bacterium]|nr:tryptophan halogenase family protein [Wenzhouxiangellaceae bacterium]
MTEQGQSTGIDNIVIVGGGTAGWMAAAALAKTFGARLDIRLIESNAIGTVGVGEATIPPIRNFNLLLELDEAEFLRAVNGTFKLGIEFENWGRLGERYFHPFAPHGTDTWAAQFHHYWLRARALGESATLDEFSLEACMARAGRCGNNTGRRANYAYHFDAAGYAALLRRLGEGMGVTRIEGKVVDVTRNGEAALIESLTLEDGTRVPGDLFIDCSGFRALLIEQTLGTGWEDWSHWLKNDRAVAVQTESTAPPAPYTRSTARSAGWQWKIPLQHRVGNGLVYSSGYMDDDTATRLLLDNLQGRPITDPRPIRFRTGRRTSQWNGNCVALGLASGFLEPLESTSIHLIQNGIIRLIKMFPRERIEPTQVEQFNREVRNEIEHIRDFIILHYHVNRRGDSPYWTDCREMDVPDSLHHKIELFAETGLVFRDDNELFSEVSWTSVMIGQGIEPAGWHPVADTVEPSKLETMMTRAGAEIARVIRATPAHQRYIDQLGAKKPVARQSPTASG